MVINVSKNSDGFSLVNQGWFTKFAKLFPHQTFLLYSMTCRDDIESVVEGHVIFPLSDMYVKFHAT